MLLQLAETQLHWKRTSLHVYLVSGDGPKGCRGGKEESGGKSESAKWTADETNRKNWQKQTILNPWTAESNLMCSQLGPSCNNRQVRLTSRSVYRSSQKCGECLQGRRSLSSFRVTSGLRSLPRCDVISPHKGCPVVCCTFKTSCFSSTFLWTAGSFLLMQALITTCSVT